MVTRMISWVVFCFCLAALMPPYGYGDDPKAKARARAALALASTELTPVAADPPVIAARAAAKAALTKACGPACPCNSCDCEPGACECCATDRSKPMPPAVAPVAAAKDKPERLKFTELRKAVEKLKPGESITAYAGQDAPVSAAGRVVVLVDAIPDEEQRIGVWKCWNESGEPKMASMQPAKGGVRVVLDGKFFDRYPDGSLYWCAACNRGK